MARCAAPGARSSASVSTASAATRSCTTRPALIAERRQDFIERIVAEAGFPVADADNEVSRTIQTLLLSAEEAKRLSGEMVPIENAPGNAHRLAFTIRVPRGVVCGITSFNSPLNMVAHKLAPALAAGNTVVIKPPQATPVQRRRCCSSCCSRPGCRRDTPR